MLPPSPLPTRARAARTAPVGPAASTPLASPAAASGAGRRYTPPPSGVAPSRRSAACALAVSLTDASSSVPPSGSQASPASSPIHGRTSRLRSSSDALRPNVPASRSGRSRSTGNRVASASASSDAWGSIRTQPSASAGTMWASGSTLRLPWMNRISPATTRPSESSAVPGSRRERRDQPRSALAALALDVVDDERNPLKRIALTQPILDEVGVVARQPLAVVDVDLEARRPGLDLRHVHELEPVALAGRRLARVRDLAEEAVELRGGDPMRGAVGQRERLLEHPSDVAASLGRCGEHARAQPQLAVHAGALGVQLSRPDAAARAERLLLAA